MATRLAPLPRAFYARQDTVTPVVAAVAAVVINTTLAVILVGPYGLPGIALAIAIAAWIEAIALLAEGFDMLEEDLDKERFYAFARRVYWESPDGSPRRALMQTLIGKLDF